MIFAQYKHAITFALAIMALAVVVADPGSDEAAKPAATGADVVQSAPQDRPVAAVAAADPEWYGATADEVEPAATPGDEAAAEAAVDDASYQVAPPSAANTAGTSRPAAAPAAAAQAGSYVAPPSPPQNFQP